MKFVFKYSNKSTRYCVAMYYKSIQKIHNCFLGITRRYLSLLYRNNYMRLTESKLNSKSFIFQEGTFIICYLADIKQVCIVYIIFLHVMGTCNSFQKQVLFTRREIYTLVICPQHTCEYLNIKDYVCIYYTKILIKLLSQN